MENSNRNAQDRVPLRATWPPPWLSSGNGRADGPAPPGPGPPVFTPSTLPPDHRDAWEERVCIMHHDGGLPWDEAERLALADVLGDGHGTAGRLV